MSKADNTLAEMIEKWYQLNATKDFSEFKKVIMDDMQADIESYAKEMDNTDTPKQQDIWEAVYPDIDFLKKQMDEHLSELTDDVLGKCKFHSTPEAVNETEYAMSYSWDSDLEMKINIDSKKPLGIRFVNDLMELVKKHQETTFDEGKPENSKSKADALTSDGREEWSAQGLRDAFRRHLDGLDCGAIRVMCPFCKSNMCDYKCYRR